ncbi:MAG: trypsin-like serine peptidase [Methyloligellaceae bacterium]
MTSHKAAAQSGIALVICAFALVAGANAEPDKRHFPGVIGSDDRAIVDNTTPPWTAIGRVNVSGYRRKRHCTGTLIAPRLVVTAAHCLVNKGSGATVPLANVHFIAGARRDTHLGHAKPACIRFMEAPPAPRAKGADRFRTDVAVIVLNDDVKVEPAALADETSYEIGLPLIHPGYGRDRRYMLTADRTCRLQKRVKGLWLTDCDTNFGGSGGPVLVKRQDGLAVAAIMVGGVRNKYSIAVPISTWRDLARAKSCGREAQ